MHAAVARADDRVLPCRPTVTCTADLAPPGTVELEVGVQLRRDDDTTPVLVKLPVASWVELQLGGNGYTITPGGDYVDSVIGGVKLHVLDQLGQRPSVAVTIAASVHDLFATAHASKDYGTLHLDWNVGVDARHVQAFTALAASYPLTAKLSATVEPHYFADAAPAAPRDAGAIAALAYAVRPWLVVDAAVEYVIADHRSVTGLAGLSIAPVRLWGRN